MRRVRSWVGVAVTVAVGLGVGVEGRSWSGSRQAETFGFDEKRAALG